MFMVFATAITFCVYIIYIIVLFTLYSFYYEARLEEQDCKLGTAISMVKGLAMQLSSREIPIPIGTLPDNTQTQIQTESEEKANLF
jgi:hypothetical protein